MAKMGYSAAEKNHVCISLYSKILMIYNTNEKWKELKDEVDFWPIVE